MRIKNCKNTIRILCGLIVAAMIAIILFLTFQSPEQTTALSETVRIWLKNHGCEMTPKQIRSIVHIPMFFLLGMVVLLFGHTMGIKLYVSILFAIGIALLDEGIKIFLPTREFEVIDLIRDIIGIGISGFLVLVVRLLRIKTSMARKSD